MFKKNLICLIALIITTVMLIFPIYISAIEPSLQIKPWQKYSVIPKYEVFEVIFSHYQEYKNPFLDVSIETTFTSPSGKQFKVGGFHYGSLNKAKIKKELPADGKDHQKIEYIFDESDIWKVRFAPSEVGKWEYSYVFSNNKGQIATGSGEFECIEGRVHNSGFVRQDSKNPFRWVFDDGTPYYPIGLQDGVFDGDGLGTVLANWALEGPFRTDRKNFPDPPPGAMFKPGPSNNPMNADIYFRRYAKGGFNLLRFSQQNFSLSLMQDFDHYLKQESIMVDEYLLHARKYGFKIFYGIFGYQNVFNEHPDDPVAMEKVKRFIKYSVDRWGAYVDFWEFLNEQKADTKWYEIMTPYLQSIDPYHHPITTSWERPEIDGIEINAPHWYSGMANVSDSDKVTLDQIREWKKFSKPVIVGEAGNWSDQDPKKRLPGIGGAWDPESHLRMRVRNWTALFNEVSFVFWNTSYAKDGHFMNIWLGPKEREYVKAMQDFAYTLGGDVRMANVNVSDSKLARAYGLASDTRFGAYILHAEDYSKALNGLTVTIDIPKAGNAYWYSPENGAILGAFKIKSGNHTFTVPDFNLDIALLIGVEAPPDSDRDGKPNDIDDDNDNDGYPNSVDAFPLDPEEWEDKDGDLIGDNMDADDDADGIGDDQNQNGIPDNEELDFDGDHIDKAGSIPWDAFPFDPNEWRDTDGDGIGDNADTDDDGDGYSDTEEKQAGTNPLDKLSFPQ